jgi:4-hydroxy-tetrahydrodipicolinate synthase
MNDRALLITAMGTPLTDDREDLHEQGLEAHLNDQYDGGIRSLLAAGTMGMMQLLSDAAYQKLIRRTVELNKGRFEVMAGAGDASFARTRDRIEFLNTLKLDAVVLLTPYFIQFAQDELIEYFRALADISKAPVLLYDLPARTRSKVEMSTVLELAKHPNIKGIKVSDEAAYSRQLIDVAPKDFRIVVAQPDLVDVLLRHGITEHLDGMFCAAPHWTSAIVRHGLEGNWDAAAKYQQQLSGLKRAMIKYNILPAFSAVMNARGIPGNFAPRPYRPVTGAQREQLLNEPIVKQLLREHPAKQR